MLVSRSFGHVFSMHVLPSGAVRLYMSFIHHYTLGKYISKHPKPLQRGDLASFFGACGCVNIVSVW